ncbi:hypothetical protein GF407_05560 [candidate division KSB1 bacterium]|nr:hypothetical protein [candidate division KSB1 bacterium]
MSMQVGIFIFLFLIPLLLHSQTWTLLQDNFESGNLDQWDKVPSDETGLFVTYQAEPAPGDSVIIDGTGFDLGAWGGMFDIEHVDYIRVNGFHIVHSTWVGIQCYNANHIEILNCSTCDTKSTGIYSCMPA